MIRALYTAASGMNAQQTNIDNVAHNLANVNTTGYKKSRIEFEDLVYQEMRTTGYTRSGAFHMDAQGLLVTAEGYSLEPQITIPNNATSVSISKDGIVSAQVAGQSAAQQLGTIEIATFSNSGGLRPLGGNLFAPTTASGDAETGAPGTDSRGTLAQSFLEDSNVSVVEEMVNMIIGQRAYEANSRVVKAADEMLAQVNNLVR